MEILVALAKNKYTWIIGAFLALLSAYGVHVWILEAKIDTLNVNNAKLELTLRNTKLSLEEVLEVNNKNNLVMKRVEEDILSLQNLNNIVVDTKDKEIEVLKNIILEIDEEVDYPKEMDYKNITIKIKEFPDENDTTFNIINNIGF